VRTVHGLYAPITRKFLVETEEVVAHRKFGSSNTTKRDRPEPITFDLGPEENLLCREYANGALLMEMIGKVESGSVSQQSQGVMEILDVVVETDDGEDPESWTGRPYNPERPLQHHTQAELEAIAEENREIREKNDEIRERNEAKGDVPEEELEEELTYVRPGVDPTSSLGRLQAVLKDRKIRIEIEDLVETVIWLTEQYTSRPTKSSSGLRRGGTGTNRSSRREQRRRGGTSEPAASAS
jgi:hypothetical protein